MPGFRNHLYLYSCAAHRSGTQSASRFPEETPAKISRTSQIILQKLRDTLPYIFGGLMSTDGVTTAFEMILEEIDSVVSEVNSQGAAFLRNNEYQHARDAIASGEKLAGFRRKLECLTNSSRLCKRDNQPTQQLGPV
jgi:hypothetical protein